MTDTVFIDGLQVRAVIGVYAWERDILQDLRVDLRLATDTRAAARDDDLTLAVDYAAISNRISELAGASRYKLIESLAEEIADTVQREFVVERLYVRITKPGAVPNARAVGVEIERP